MFEIIFYYCVVGLVYVSFFGEFIWVNKMLSDFFGYDIEVFLILFIQEIIVFFYFVIDLNLLNKIFCGEIDIYSLEKKYLYKEGYEVWGKFMVLLVRDKQGKLDYFIFVVEDIDNMKKVELELFQVEVLFSEIVLVFFLCIYIWVVLVDLIKLYYVNEGF